MTCRTCTAKLEEKKCLSKQLYFYEATRALPQFMRYCFAKKVPALLERQTVKEQLTRLVSRLVFVNRQILFFILLLVPHRHTISEKENRYFFCSLCISPADVEMWMSGFPTLLPYSAFSLHFITLNVFSWFSPRYKKCTKAMELAVCENRFLSEVSGNNSVFGYCSVLEGVRAGSSRPFPSSVNPC